MNKKYLAYLYAIPPILIWASTPVVVKILLKSLNFAQVFLFSSFFAILFFAITIAVKKKYQIFSEYNSKDYFRMIALGLCLFLQYLFLYSAIDISTAQEAFIITYLWPIWVVILAIPLLKEKLSFTKIAGLLLGFIGVYTISVRGSFFEVKFIHPLGNSLALLAAFALGLYFTLNKKYNYERFTSMLIYYISAFILALFSIITFSSFPSLALPQLLGLLWIGIFIYSIAYASWFNALQLGDTAKISNLGFLVPFVSLIYIYFALDEPVLMSSVLGLILIMAGIFIQHLRKE